MGPVKRRRLLCGVAVSLASAGCSATGHNPTLRLHNRFHEAVDLRLTAYRQFVGEGRDTEEVFFEETVAIEAGQSKELEVFTEDDQYRVIVERTGHSVEFQTRPICSSASTTVTVRPSGAIEYHVEFCEGGPHTGSSNSS